MRKAALNVANVVTYVAVVTFSNTDGRLLPGMTANVRVVTDQRENALKVPNAALRVRIAGVEPVSSAPNSGAVRGDSAGTAGQNGTKNEAEKPAATTVAAAPAAGQGGGGGASPQTEFRKRLEAELKLTPDQLEKVDAIYASVRPKFGQLRDLPEADRAKARERITADIRARIAELLTPEQKPRYAAMAAEQAGRTVTRGRIYLMDAAGKPKAFNARLGISDGTSTELIVSPNSADTDELKEGAAIITGTVTPGSASTPARPGTTGPRMVF